MSARFAAACAVLLLSGCSHPENYRWAEGSHPDFEPVDRPAGTEFDWGPGPSANVYTYATAQPPAASLSVTGLSDRAQAAWIEALAKAKFDADKAGTALSKPFGPKDSGGGAATREESFSRTLVVTVSEGLNAGPADRLAWSWIDIRPKNFLFDGYTIAATDNEQLNVETVQNQTTASLQGQAGLTTSNTNAATNSVTPPQSTGGAGMSDVLTKVLGTSAGATGSLSNVYTTSATVNQQYEKLHLDIRDRELRIFRGSERNLDVTGNTLVALSLKVDPARWIGSVTEQQPSVTEIVVQRVSKLTLADKGKTRAPAKVDLEASLDKLLPSCPLKADVTLIYQLRRVVDARSYIEGEQKADYIQGKKEYRNVTLIPSAEARKPSWRVRAQDDKDHFVYLEQSGDLLPLDFSTYEQALDFAHWLNQHRAWLKKRVKHAVGTDDAALSWAGFGTGEAFPSAIFIADRFSDTPSPDMCSTMDLKPDATAAPAR